MADAQPARVFCFGPFEADLRNRLLLQNGAPVSLQGQPFDVLALLLEHPGQLVTRDQLRARLWPSGTVVEFDHSIHAAVTKVREVLGEQADHPRYIATVPRHGYRFIAPVSTPAPTALEPPLAYSQPFALQALAHAVSPPGLRLDRAFIAVLAVLAVGVGYVVVSRFWISRPSVVVQPAASTQPPASRDVSSGNVAAFSPPPHSIAVLPFVNISGKKEQEYFSDGLTEELLSSLTRINGLQVAAQTSSFYFKAKDADLTTIAHKLNVGAVLEGSVRRSGQRVRVTAQLIDSMTGFHLWSQTYDRKLGDVLSLQTEIANAVANALKVTWLGDNAAKIELGGTHSPGAFDAYLRGSRALSTFNDRKDLQAAAAAYTAAIRLDPNYALAYTGRSRAYKLDMVLMSPDAGAYATGTALREGFDKAQADARQAIALAPELAEGHLALAGFLESSLDFRPASEEYERAFALSPGSAAILDGYGSFTVFMGRAEVGIAAVRHAVALDPLNPVIRRHLGRALNFARRYDEGVAVLQEAVALDPNSKTSRSWLGQGYYLRGDFRSAQASCDIKSEHPWLLFCLVLSYDRLGRHADAEAELAKYQAALGDWAAYQYAEIHAQRGEVATALEWLGTAMRLRDSGLEYVKTDPFLDPLRKESRFQAIERELKFPN